jgi:hypothetical protein
MSQFFSRFNQNRKLKSPVSAAGLMLGSLLMLGSAPLPSRAAVNPVLRPTSPPPQILPRIDSFAPVSGQIGTRVVITGVNLGNTVEVKFGNVTAAVLGKTATTVTTQVPAGIALNNEGVAKASISIANNADDTARSGGEFTITSTRVQSFSPSNAPANAVVTLSGSGLGNATSVKFGTVSAAIIYKSENQVTTRVPANAPPSDFITVITPNASPKTNTVFTKVQPTVAAPTITGFTPASGVIGTDVTINGNNLSSVTSVKFNNISANFDVLSSTKIRAIVPSGASTGRITVTRGTQTATSNANFSVTTSTVKSIIGRITNGAGVGLANVVVQRFSNGQFFRATTDSSGNYSFKNLSAGENLIIPIQSGTIFTNAQGQALASVTISTSSVPNVNFTGTQKPGTFSISGKVVNKAGQPMPGTWVTGTNVLVVGGAMTNDRGEYTFANLPAGLYFIQPLKAGFTWTPGFLYGNVAVSSTNNNFQVSTSPAPPANDVFAAAKVLSGASGRITGNNVGATKQVGEANHANVPGGHSLWYKWTATSNGLLTVTTAGSTTTATTGVNPGPVTDTLLAAYSGTAVNTLTAIGANNDVSTTDRTSRIVISVQAGRTYYIAADTPYYLCGGIVLNWSFAASATPTPTATTPPPNDMFASAQLVSGVSGKVAGRNNGATKESGEPAHNGSSAGKSVWYKWVAPGRGMATFNTQGSTFDSVMAVYKGTAVNALTKVVSNDDASPTVGTSSVTFATAANQLYYIAVDSYRTTTGNVTLNWNLVLDRGPANDDFGTAQVLSNASGRVTGNNVEADKEAGEPAHHGNTGGKSLWYKWTAPQTGNATFDTIGSTFDTVLAVYRGSSVGALTRLGSDDDSGGNRTSRCVFPVTQGSTYFVAVDGYNGASGTVVLNWSTTNSSSGSQEVEMYSPWVWQVSGSTLTIGVDEVYNASLTAASNNVRLELWAFPSRFTGANQSGFLLGVVNLGSIAPDESLFEVIRSTTYQGPPAGTYYVTLLLTEQQGNEYFFYDFLDDEQNPWIFSSGASTNSLTRNAPVPSTRSTMQATSTELSSTQASADGRITLNFTAPLANATGSNFVVTINEVATKVESASVDATRAVLQMESTLNAGDKVQVAWKGLRDSQGRNLADGSAAVEVR